MMSSRVSPLRQLADLISQSVTQIDDAYEKAGLEYPSLDTPFDPTSPGECLSMSHELIQASSLIVAACGQLGATVSAPASTLLSTISGVHASAALRVALQGNTVEILRENPQGLHTQDISKQNGIDPAKLARILRILCTHHIFREVSPDVFANNRVSSLLDTTKSVAAIKADPVNKHVQTPGFSAIMELSTDEVFKGAAHLAEVLLDPKLGPSEAPEHSPMMVAMKSSKAVWEWYEEPGNEYRFKRLTAGMTGAAKVDPPNAILQGFKWGDLPADSVIVDVGGGVGHNTLQIAREYKHLKYVVQDRQAVIEQAKEYWNTNLPTAISDGSVQLIAHDFFTPQPVKNASAFLLRAIVHDYGKTQATQILSHLRAVAQPYTKLVLVEGVVPYACSDDRVKEIAASIPGAEPVEPPKPLLANFGKAGAVAYLRDLQMLISLNGEERTLKGYIELASGTGWKIQEIIRIPGSMTSHIVAVPV